MKKVLFLFALIFGIFFFSQAPRFKKSEVPEINAHVYFPGDVEWDKTMSEDGSEVFTAETIFGKIKYFAIVVKFNEETIKALTAPEYVLESYMLYLEDSVFEMVQKADIGRGHILKNQADTKGFLRYGKSRNGEECVEKGWTNGKYLTVLAMSSTEEMNPNFQELFLNSIRFPK